MTFRDNFNAFYRPLKGCCGYIPQRYFLSFMCFMAILNAYTIRLSLNVAVTVMVVKTGSAKHHVDPDACQMVGNLSESSIQQAEFAWDQTIQGLLLSAFYWGYVTTHIPGGLLATRFGGTYTLSSGIALAAVGCIFTPLAADLGGWPGVMAVRILQGMGQGVVFPSVNVLLAHWCPPHEKSFHASLAFAGSLIGNVVGHSTSGLVLHASDHDWRLLFYIWGVVALVWCALFLTFCSSDPAYHPLISDKEKAFLKEKIVNLGHGKDRPPTPWKAVLTSIPLWGLIVAQIGHDWIFFTMVTDLPKYMNDVMKFKVKELGFYSSLPYLAEFIVSLGAGAFADYLIKRDYMTTTMVRRVFAFFASFGPCVGVVSASYAGCDKTAAVALFTFGMAIMGTFYASIKVNALDLSPNFAGLTLALVNGIGAVSGIIVPLIIGVMTPESTMKQWRTVFWVTAAVTMLTNLIYSVTVSGEVQSWNSVQKKPEGEDGANPTGAETAATSGTAGGK